MVSLFILVVKLLQLKPVNHDQVPNEVEWYVRCVEDRRDLRITFLFSTNSASVSLSMLAKPESRLVTVVGNCTVWSMESSPTVRCPVTRPSAVETIRSTLSSARPALESTFRELCLLTWSQQ